MRRDETLKRNASIYRRFLKGVSKDDLAEKFGLDRKHVTSIISAQKARNSGNIEEERMRKVLIFNYRLEKLKQSIEVGDVVVLNKKIATDAGKGMEIKRLSGEVIYKDNHFVTVRGEQYVEAFSYDDLQKMMVSHFK